MKVTAFNLRAIILIVQPGVPTRRGKGPDV